jgi:hypothetical protein
VPGGLDGTLPLQVLESGEIATAKPTNTRCSFRVITGSSSGKGMRLSSSTISSRSEGYRRLTFMMLDRDIVAVSPSSTYRVLKGAGLLDCWKPKPSLKGAGFVQPLAPPEHWHVDVS